MRHAAAELCLLVSQGAHDRIRQALHLAADNCTLARFPKAVESSGCGWRRIKWERARGRHDRIGQAALVCVSAGVPWSIGGNERASCCYHCCCYYCWVCQSVLGVLYCLGVAAFATTAPPARSSALGQSVQYKLGLP